MLDFLIIENILRYMRRVCACIDVQLSVGLSGKAARYPCQNAKDAILARKPRMLSLPECQGCYPCQNAKDAILTRMPRMLSLPKCLCGVALLCDKGTVFLCPLGVIFSTVLLYYFRIFNSAKTHETFSLVMRLLSPVVNVKLDNT